LLNDLLLAQLDHIDRLCDPYRLVNRRWLSALNTRPATQAGCRALDTRRSAGADDEEGSAHSGWPDIIDVETDGLAHPHAGYSHQPDQRVILCGGQRPGTLRCRRKQPGDVGVRRTSR
jgi:hypothetical protein